MTTRKSWDGSGSEYGPNQCVVTDPFGPPLRTRLALSVTPGACHRHGRSTRTKWCHDTAPCCCSPGFKQQRVVAPVTLAPFTTLSETRFRRLIGCQGHRIPPAAVIIPVDQGIRRPGRFTCFGLGESHCSGTRSDEDLQTMCKTATQAVLYFTVSV